MSIPEQHHILSEMILRRFAAPNGRLFYFDKRCPEKGIRDTVPRKLFRERHRYSSVDDQGSHDPILEIQFGNLETRAAPVLERIIASARGNHLPNLSAMEKAILDEYTYMSWRRVPDFFSHFIADFETDHKDFLVEYERDQGEVSPDVRLKYESPETIAMLKQNAIVKGLAAPSDKILNAFQNRGTAIIRIVLPNKSFAIASNPVLKLSMLGEGSLLRPEVEVIFPIAWDIAIVSVGNRGETRFVTCAEDRQIRYINELLFKNSSMIAGRSRELIASLARCN